MDAAGILQHHRIKKTSPRVAILQGLQNSDFPLSENEIREKMGSLYDRITFYRSIQTLMNAGVIHRIVADNTHIKYALNDCRNGHHHTPDHIHFFCHQCHTIVCLDHLKIQSYPLPEGYIPRECEVVIKGLCEKCALHSSADTTHPKEK